MNRWIVLLLCLLVAGTVLGSEEGVHSEEGEHHNKNEVLCFLGVTHEKDVGDSFTFGAEYEWRFAEYLGAGALVDIATGEGRSWIGGLPIFVHPWRGLVLIGAPGIERRKDEVSRFLMRAGICYLFEIGRLELAPSFDVDFVEGEETYVYGLNIGTSW